MSSSEQKLAISIFSAALYSIINLKQTYKFTDMILPWSTENLGCPTAMGILTHSLVFFIISYISMWNIPNKMVKIKHSLYGTLIFFFLSNPVFYKFLGKLFGGTVSSYLGCPTTFGILLTSFIYCIALLGVMYLPN